MTLQKAIVYELFAIFLAVVICAISLAESITAGYSTGPWLALAFPTVIALVGFLKALGANDASQPSPDVATDDDGEARTDTVEESDHSTAVVPGYPPY